MRSLLRSAAISFFVVVVNNNGGPIQGVNCARVKQTLEQKSSIGLTNQFLTDKSYVETESELTTKSKSQAEIDQQNQAKWGFLKNIVNIDRFFASGPEDAAPKKEAPKEEKKEEEKKDDKKSLHQKTAKSKKSSDEMEDEEMKEMDSPSPNDETNVQKKVNKKATPPKKTTKMAQIKSQKEDEEEQPQQQEEEKSETTAVETATTAQEAAEDKQDEEEQEAPPQDKANIETKQSSTPNQTYGPVFKNKAEKEKHAEEVRDEGLTVAANKMNDNEKEVNLEIEAPGAANSVAEEGSKTIQSADEFKKLTKQLAAARKKPENKLGKGGFLIELKDPKSFENSMRVVVMGNQNLPEKEIKAERFDTRDNAQTQAASMAMAMTLQTEVGATIVDDQPGKESIIQNFNSDVSKITSQISSGYSIRNNYVQKMAPGDKQFHMVSWDANKKFNNMKTFEKRPEAEKDFSKLGNIPKILISGETGDVLLSNGDQKMVDQCLGMFYTQRYQGKYFGQP